MRLKKELAPEFNMFDRELNDDWAAFETEAVPFMPDVYRVARYLARNETEAEDLTQETFMQALTSFHRYQSGTNCRAWLVTILYHTNSKRRRKIGRLQLVADTEERIAETVSFEPPTPQDLTDEDILQALEKLPQQFREVVLLSDVEELAYKEIAELLKVPIGTVMSRLHRGRKLLRLELTDYAEREFGITAKS